MILADGEDVRDLVPTDERIRLVHLASSHNIGEKRNFGCKLARGQIICHWDDDDWSSPERLAHQVATLTASGRGVTGFHSMRFTDGHQWWLYTGPRSSALGTSLCFLKSWWAQHPFPSSQLGEDNRMIDNAFAARQLVTEDSAALMYATNHPGNTSPRRMGSNWKLIS